VRLAVNVVGISALRVEGEQKVTGRAVYAANAVEDAVGVRIKSLPITAEKVLAALKGL